MHLVVQTRAGRPVVALAMATVIGLAGCGDGDDRGGGGGDRAVEDERGAAERRGEGGRDRDRAPGGDGRSSAPGKTATVTRVVDGDTVELEGIGAVRLIGVDTPERGDCGFDEATRFTEQRIGGERVRYVLGRERRDRYGRLLAYLFDSPGRMHNLSLARAGYAKVLTIAPNDRFAGRFEAAVSSARGRYARVPRGACERPAEPSRPSPSRPEGGSQRPPSGGESLPAPPPDLDCSDLPGPVRVGPGDPHRLDADGDGIGCD
jgi:endonuclease YncB( thermonuclease family)